MEANKVWVDAGHGGDDNGAVWSEKLGYLEEDDINLSVAYLLRCELYQKYVDTLMTREMDINVSLLERSNGANEEEMDAFISIHCDAWHNVTTQGISVHIYPFAPIRTVKFAEEVYDNLMSEFRNHKRRGIVKSNFHVLRETKMPAILIECEFITNPDTRKFLREPFNQLRIARAIAKGVQ